MEEKIGLAKYLKQKNKDLMCLRVLQESITLFVLHCAFLLYGSLESKLEILLLMGMTSVGYFILWLMFLKRNRDNIYIFFICGNTKRIICRILYRIMFYEITIGIICGNACYIIFQFAADIQRISIAGVISNSLILAGFYTVISFVGTYVIITKQIAVAGAENERNIFHNI